MRKQIISTCFVVFCTMGVANSQTVVLPGGTAGIGNSNPNPGVGVFTTNPLPSGFFEVRGDVRLNGTSSGNDGVLFSSPNAEKGMSIVRPLFSNRADVRFDGNNLRLLVGPNSGPPSATSGITISNSQNVGIGVSAPTKKLTLSSFFSNDGIRATQTFGGYIGLELENQTPGGKFWGLLSLGSGNGQGPGNLLFYNFSNSTSDMIIDGDNGFVGIGTTSPNHRLHVNGSVEIDGLPGTASAANVLTINGSGELEISSASFATGSGTTNHVSKWTGSGTLGDANIYDDGTNVGIGTTSPNNTLHVNGTVEIDGLPSTSSSANVLTINSSGELEVSTASFATGTGTTNYIPKWTGANTLSSTSNIFDDGVYVGIGTNTPVSALTVTNGNFSQYNGGLDGSTDQRFELYADDTKGLWLDAPKDAGGNRLPIALGWRSDAIPGMHITPDKRVGVGIDAPNMEAKVHIKTTDITNGSTSSVGLFSEAINSLSNWNIGSYGRAFYGYMSTAGVLEAKHALRARGLETIGLSTGADGNSEAEGIIASAHNALFTVGIISTAMGKSGATKAVGVHAMTSSNNGPSQFSPAVHAETFSPPSDVTTPNFGIYAKMWGLGVNSQSYAGYFDGGVNNSGFFNGSLVSTTPTVIISDRKFKNGIDAVEDALDKIMQLKPSTYTYYGKDKFPSFNFPQGKQYGFIAQEVEKVLPELVREKTNPAQYDSAGKKLVEAVDFKGIEYTAIIPVLVAGMQEQQEMIEQQNAKIAELEERLAKLEKGGATNIGSTGTQTVNGAALYQNTPNPFNSHTEIGYKLPEQYNEAKIMVFDMNGRQVRVVALAGEAEGKVSFYPNELAAGMYMYSLVIDGKEIDTKRMILAGR